jgi:peroxiredoxin
MTGFHMHRTPRKPLLVMGAAIIAAALLHAFAGTAARAAQPAPAPDFVLPAMDGTELRLSELKGQVVMVNFWATWCGPCRQEMPLLQQLQLKYEPLGFTLVGINVEPDSAGARTWLQKAPVTFPILFDRQNQVAERFGVQGMPSSVFIDRTGKVRHVHRGYQPGDESKYADMVRSLVKE